MVSFFGIVVTYRITQRLLYKAVLWTNSKGLANLLVSMKEDDEKEIGRAAQLEGGS